MGGGRQFPHKNVSEISICCGGYQRQSLSGHRTGPPNAVQRAYRVLMRLTSRPTSTYRARLFELQDARDFDELYGKHEIIQKQSFQDELTSRTLYWHGGHECFDTPISCSPSERQIYPLRHTVKNLNVNIEGVRKLTPERAPVGPLYRRSALLNYTPLGSPTDIVNITDHAHPRLYTDMRLPKSEAPI